ncbi:MAG: hypothetical protein LUG99_10855 [Lachnospiraceae bacterium]|nr:hypothetical protein [Lachnospiraceae bacterium]
MSKRVKMHPEKKSSVGDNFISAVIALISLLISVCTAVISILVEFDAFQTVATALLSFLCSEYVVNSLMLKSRYFKARNEYQFMESMNQWSDKFYEMNEYSRTILEDRHGDKDLFVATCSRSIDSLYYLLKRAAVEKKIEITTDFLINTTGVFDALNVASQRTIELTFPIDEIKDRILQTAEDEKFFETAYKMVMDNQVHKVRVLLILGDTGLIRNEKLLALCRFYQSNKAYECKYILKSDFIEACNNNMIQSGTLDFGIYGPKMLFRVEQYEPYKGVYSKDEDQVRRYLSLYNEVWNFESVTHSIQLDNVQSGTPMTLTEFFDEMNSNAVIDNADMVSE